MISASACGPLCQHPGCWKAKSTPPPPEYYPPPLGTPEPELPTLSVSLLEPRRIHRHRSLPPIRRSTGHISTSQRQKSLASTFQPYREKEPVPRVSHIIVQAGFQCHAQKRWIWLPSMQGQQSINAKSTTIVKPALKDVTDDLIQSRPASSKIVHSRNMQTRLMNSRPKGSSYLDLVRKLGYLNLLDLPHYLQVKLLENAQFRKLLSSHPIDRLPYNALPDTALLDLVRSQLSPQLPANPSLEGVGIFFDPPDDLAAKQEPHPVILPRRRDDWPEPSTYVPSTRVIEPSSLPGPQVLPAMVPNFREYVMKKRSSREGSAVKTEMHIPTEAPFCPSHVTSVTTTIRDSSEESHKEEENDEEEEEEEEEEETAPQQSLEITLPADESGIRIPSAIEESEEPELIGITSSSLPPTRDSWRHTSFSTVTPLSPAIIDIDKVQLLGPAMTPPQETKTISNAASAASIIQGCQSNASNVVGPSPQQETLPGSPEPAPSSPGIPPPTCTPTAELANTSSDLVEEAVMLREDGAVTAPPGTPNNEVDESAEKAQVDEEEKEALSIPETPDGPAAPSEFSDTESPPKEKDIEE